MREVAMPTGFAAQSRRGPIALIAASLIVLQAFLAGVAAGQAGAPAAIDLIDPAAICHGSGRADPAGTGVPDAGKAWHLCCAYCTNAVSAITPPDAARLDPLEPRPAGRLLASAGFTIVLPPGAVRAGPSQAPPGRA
jgi:Protein of unknown function (DUF2946)